MYTLRRIERRSTWPRKKERRQDNRILWKVDGEIGRREVGEEEKEVCRSLVQFIRLLQEHDCSTNALLRERKRETS